MKGNPLISFASTSTSASAGTSKSKSRSTSKSRGTSTGTGSTMGKIAVRYSKNLPLPAIAVLAPDINISLRKSVHTHHHRQSL